MGHCRKIKYFAFRRIHKKHKEASDFHCCRRQKYLQTTCLERAGPTLFNEYFVSYIFLIFSDFLSSERRAWNRYLSFRSSRLRFLTSKQILCLPTQREVRRYFKPQFFHSSDLPPPTGVKRLRCDDLKILKGKKWSLWQHKLW